LVQDGTVVFYGGLAAEQFSGTIIEAFYMALDAIVSQGMDPRSSVQPPVAEANIQADNTPK